MDSKEISIRIGKEEIGRILNLKEDLDHNEVVLSHLARYRRLGWVFEGIDARKGTPLGLESGESQDEWSRRLTSLSLEGIQVNMRVRTGRASRLLVLEVNQGEGALLFEQVGDWRSDCIAAVGQRREQHYYALPAESQTVPSYFQAPQVLIYGEGGLVLTPPSLENQGREPWRWVQSPWEAPLPYPKPAVWQFLKEHLPPVPGEPEVPSWQDLYRLVAPYPMVLKALLFPAPSPEAYFQGILKAAVNVGLKDRTLLLGLLWHAPHGDARGQAERWEHLEDLVTVALGETQAAPLPATRSGVPGDPEATPAPSPLAARLGLDSLNLAGLQSSAPGMEGDQASAKFDQSVSGQFFQLLAGLGEKVIAESCRYEAMLAGLGTRDRELHTLVAEWENNMASPQVAPVEGAKAGEPGPIEFEWATAINQQLHKRQHLEEVQTAIKDFLQTHPDLTDDRDKIHLVLFYLRNYVSINPEWARLSFREKLDKAGAMARDYLKEYKPTPEG